MVKKQQITNNQNIHKTSALESFNLAFEYDKTLQEIKRDVRVRTI